MACPDKLFEKGRPDDCIPRNHENPAALIPNDFPTQTSVTPRRENRKELFFGSAYVTSLRRDNARRTAMMPPGTGADS